MWGSPGCRVMGSVPRRQGHQGVSAPRGPSGAAVLMVLPAPSHLVARYGPAPVPAFPGVVPARLAAGDGSSFTWGCGRAPDVGTRGLGLLWRVAAPPGSQSRCGSGGWGTQPQGLVEILREAEKGGRNSRVQRAKGGGISIPCSFEGEGNQRMGVLGRILEVQTPVSREGGQIQKLNKF